jgi:hypothetical protein
LFECTGTVFHKSDQQNLIAFLSEGKILTVFDLAQEKEIVIAEGIAAFCLDGVNIAYVNTNNRVFYHNIQLGGSERTTSCDIPKTTLNLYHLVTIMKHAIILSGFTKQGTLISRFITLIDKRFMTQITEYEETSTLGKLNRLTSADQDYSPLVHIAAVSNYKQNLNVLIGRLAQI